MWDVLQRARRSASDVLPANFAEATEMTNTTPDQSRTPELHPESVCGSCKGENPGPWSAPNDLWNQIVGSPYGIMCPNCFITLANEMGVTNVWDVAPRITPPDVQEAEPVAAKPPSGDAEDARDAARYRWLVANIDFVMHGDWSWVRRALTSTSISERIDAAMLAKGEK